MELLRTEPDSKRGYLPVFSAAELNVSDNPGMACLAGLHLPARGGRLHMVCNMRANGLDCGLLSDVFSFTMIQEYAAVQLGLELGTYTHHIGSAHVNDRNTERVQKVLNEVDARSHPQHFPFWAMPTDTNPDTITRVLEHEELLRTNKVRYSAADIAYLDVDAYWQQVLLLFEAYRQVVHDQADAVSRDVLAALRVTIANRRDVTVQPWQAHVHYWDLLVDADWFPDRDIPACLDAAYAGKTVAVALAYGEPGIHARLHHLIGHFDPTRAAAGTIRGDLGNDSPERALAEKRLVRNLVHTSDDPDAARRDFGTWFGASRRELLAPPVPPQAVPTDALLPSWRTP
ncbi:thymidylate synthase [Streptomyces sp. NPDC101227]|uniref:thymidylate synthase n=1 Tax=Streptomyces sp. NPDC101227 TaxID=3366136 RepID=UPI003801A303